MRELIFRTMAGSSLIGQNHRNRHVTCVNTFFPRVPTETPKLPEPTCKHKHCRPLDCYYVSTTGADETPGLWADGPRRRNVILHATRVVHCRRLWPCRLDQLQANRIVPGNCLVHALLSNHGLVEMSGQLRTLALCNHVSAQIASACTRKAQLPDACSC